MHQVRVVCSGGPGSLNVDVVKSALESSAQPRTSTPEMAQGIGANQSGFVAVTALGQSYFGLNYLTLNWSIEELVNRAYPERFADARLQSV